MTTPQRADATGRPASPGVTGGAHAGVAAASPAFRIRWGRLALAVAGLLSLLTAVVSTLLQLFGVGSGWLPLTALLGAVAAVSLLRRLAVRDRRRKMNAAFRAAMAPGHAPARPAAPVQVPALPADRPGVRPESPLFDAEAGRATPEPAVQPAVKPLTAQDLRQAALAEAAASGDTPAAVAGDPAAAAEGSSWEPVDVPKPTYVEAPKAERAAPKPLDLPQAPKAVGKPSLKQASVRPAASEPRPAGDDSEAKPLGKAQSALSNLDDVLQRRRA